MIRVWFDIIWFECVFVRMVEISAGDVKAGLAPADLMWMEFREENPELNISRRSCNIVQVRSSLLEAAKKEVVAACL